MYFYFKIFLQGIPFIMLLTYLVVTKRKLKNMVFFYTIFPSIFYFLAIVFMFKIGGLNTVTVNVFIVNIIFSLWSCYLFQIPYDMDVFEYIVRKKFEKLCYSPKYDYIRVDRKLFLNSIEETKKSLWYFPKYVLSYVDGIIAEMFVEEKIYKDIDCFLEEKLKEKKIKNENILFAFNYLYKCTISYIQKHNIAFDLEFSNIPKNIYESFFDEYSKDK